MCGVVVVSLLSSSISDNIVYFSRNLTPNAFPFRFQLLREYLIWDCTQYISAHILNSILNIMPNLFPGNLIFLCKNEKFLSWYVQFMYLLPIIMFCCFHSDWSWFGTGNLSHECPKCKTLAGCSTWQDEMDHLCHWKKGERDRTEWNSNIVNINKSRKSLLK